MTVSPSQQTGRWPARIAWALLLIMVGAGASTYLLSRWDAGARFFGVTPVVTASDDPAQTGLIAEQPAPDVATLPAAPAEDQVKIGELENRLAVTERQAQVAVGSAGRADALLIAFAARRAVDRGVALGYLEPLLLERFGEQHRAAVSTIITGAREPVSLDKLTEDYRALDDVLRGRGPDESWWSGFKRELGSLVSVRQSDAPSALPKARYDRALRNLEHGDVEAALTETMRLPGSGYAGDWVTKARRYIAVQRALDQIESAALLGSGSSTDGGVASPR